MENVLERRRGVKIIDFSHFEDEVEAPDNLTSGMFIQALRSCYYCALGQNPISLNLCVN